MVQQSVKMSVFEDLLNHPQNDLIDQVMQDGSIPIGYLCSYVPDVLLSIDRLIPVRLRAPMVSGTEIADIYLSSVICSYARSLLEAAMDEQYNFLSGFIFTASCDHLRRLYDNLDYVMKPNFIHMMDVPHRLGDGPLSFYVEELNRLMEQLSTKFNIDYSSESIMKAIRQHNDFIAILLSIGEMRKCKYPLITGTEFHTLMLASQVAPKKMLIEKIESFKESLDERDEVTDYRARVLIVGGQLDDPGYLNIIESTGALVVADHLCTGSIPGLDAIKVNDDPVESVASHYLNKVSCPRMMEEFDSRLERILRTIEEYSVDGIIIEYIKFCDIWGIEAGLLASSLRKKGFSVLCLERDYRTSGEGQIKTRVQAFLESMGR